MCARPGGTRVGICGAEVRPGLVSAGFTPHAGRIFWDPFVLQISVYENTLHSFLTHSPAAGGEIRLRFCLRGNRGILDGLTRQRGLLLAVDYRTAPLGS